jgi:lysyl-tRNA synthetase class 2
MGVDRLTMLLTGHDTIREVLLFPHLRSQDEHEAEESA